jgi:hypothetical protein
MVRTHLQIGAVAALTATPAAADMLMLQQTVLPDEAASVALLVDRERVAVVRLRQGTKPAYLVEITLAAQPNLVVTVNCQDVAGARQVLDALRSRGPATLDVSGRCWF